METAVVRISVIIPTRNREADLRRCLAGLDECVRRIPPGSGIVLYQVVLVDDASSEPGAMAPAGETGLPVTLLRNPGRLGAGASRRRAIGVADGDVLAFLDDDAVPRGDWLAVAATVHDTQPAITGRVLGFDAGVLSRARQARYDARYRDLRPAAPVSFFACGNSAVLTEVFHQAGGFANDGVGGDNSFAVAMERNGTPVRFQPDLVIAHRNGKGWGLALRNAWSAGANHPERMTFAQLRGSAANSAVGDTRAVRELNRALGVVHALGRVMPRPREDGDGAGPRAKTAQAPLGPDRVPPSAARCRVGVIGLGYAGLPQAIAFAQAGHPVTGVDENPAVVAALRSGRSPLETLSHQQVSRPGSSLTATADPQALAGCSVVLVCVPTPLDEAGLPDLSALRTACGQVAGTLRPGQLVVIESTVHPGVTDGVVKPILERSGLRAGLHFSLAFAPERVDTGNPVFGPTNTPKVVGGLTSVCTLRAQDLYRSVVPSVHVVGGLREAEAAKILENTYRQVNIALVQEFAAYCDAQGIDVTTVIDAAATKPFGFQPFYPGIGVGGHCIPVDPMFLAYSGRELGVPLRLVELAQRINDDQPRLVAERCEKLLADAGKSLSGAEVLVLGLSYKPDVADMRNTPAQPLMKMLVDRGAAVSVHDPLVPEIVVQGTRFTSVPDLPAALARADLVIVAQRHASYTTELLRPAALLYLAGRRDPGRS
jgi:nucleotide sugar dehydrogenase